LFGQLEPASVELTDSLGTVVGPVLDFAPIGFTEVPLVIDGHPTYLAFHWNAAVVDPIQTLTGVDGVYFGSADCTGQGFAYYPGSFLEPQAVGGTGNTFFAGPSVPPIPFAYNSVLRGGQSCVVESSSLTSAAPVNPVRNLTPPWVPPFKVQYVTTTGLNAVPAVSPQGLAALVVLLAGAGIALLRVRAVRRRPPASS
jgi:hypothetical protein